MELIQGMSRAVSTVVSPSMTAAAFAREDGERYPLVLATPFMLGEMERAAAALLKAMLGEGQLSVGSHAEIVHLAPTPVGARVTSHARFDRRDGALFWFDVWSEDKHGTVGRGRHSRAIVDGATIEARAAKRR